MTSVARAVVAWAGVILSGASLWGRPNISKLSADCKAGNQNACRQLEQIALQSKNTDLRVEAISALRNQSLLAQLAAGNSDFTVQEAAVDALTDQTMLAKLALQQTDKYSRVGQLALSKLNDPSLLADVALTANMPDILRLNAISRLKEQKSLARVAIESTNVRIGSEAVKKIVDPALLARIATEGKEPALRIAAVWSLTDPAQLAKVMQADPDESVRKAASMASQWKVAQTEREIYVWKASAADSDAASRLRWRINGVFRPAGLDENVNVSTSSLLDRNIESDLQWQTLMPYSAAAGFPVWWFAPGSDHDECILESGSIVTASVGLNPQKREISAPISFVADKQKAKGIWELSETKAVLLFRPNLHIDSEGKLAIGGALAVYDETTSPTLADAHVSQIATVPVTVTGAIRFPEDHWTYVGAGFDIKGGGLRFDETGVFLIPGTQYRQRAGSQ